MLVEVMPSFVETILVSFVEFEWWQGKSFIVFNEEAFYLLDISGPPSWTGED